MVALGSWNGAVGHLAETGVNDEPMIMAIRNWQSMSTDLVHDGRISPLPAATSASAEISVARRSHAFSGRSSRFISPTGSSESQAVGSSARSGIW
jgi:hypothetical protein